MRIYYLIILVIVLSLLGCTPNENIPIDTVKEVTQTSTQEIQVVEDDTQQNVEVVSIPLSENILDAQNIQYLGAFRLPDDGNTEEMMFSYGGEALCHNPSNDTLFIAGHNWFTYIAEITIVEPKISTSINELNQAVVVTPFTDIRDSLFDEWTMEIPRLGIEVVDENLFFCFGQHFEEETLRATHGYANLSLDVEDKICQVGEYQYTTNDYMFKIPEKYQDSFGGADLLTGRYRDGGWGGMGPNLYLISSGDIISASNKASIDTIQLLHYDDSYNGDDGIKMNGYSHADSITGGAFVSNNIGSSVIFVATHGFGETWYGFSNGVVYPIGGDEGEEYPDVPPYPHDERGWWNDDFNAAFIMYDPSQLAMVGNGEYDANQVQPYAIVNISEYMYKQTDETDMQYLGGCAYDINTNRLYVLELFADESKPIVHVFTFN